MPHLKKTVLFLVLIVLSLGSIKNEVTSELRRSTLFTKKKNTYSLRKTKVFKFYVARCSRVSFWVGQTPVPGSFLRFPRYSVIDIMNLTSAYFFYFCYVELINKVFKTFTSNF